MLAARGSTAVKQAVGVHGYRWEPDAGLYAVDDDRVVGVLDTPGAADAAEQRLKIARRLLVEAEASRAARRRPPAMLDAMAEGFAQQRLAAVPQEPLTIPAADIIAWIDGPGLDVILGFVLSRRGR
ncbi:MAG: hypothetical protein QOE86_2342 [Solirubrobacteraceae bacterium]|jgi:hypothetical protein|nr:hypothetical protein [Solirubrobacteraceae bacterium]